MGSPQERKDNKTAVLELAHEMGLTYEDFGMFRDMWPDLRTVVDLQSELLSHGFELVAVHHGFTLRKTGGPSCSR